MPLINSDFSGNRYWKNGHAETMIPPLLRSTQVPFSRQRIELPDGDFLDIDNLHAGNDKILILLHGLEGSSQSQYIRGFAAYFSQKSWDITAINHRSCSGEINRKLISYHSGATADLAWVVNLLAQQNKWNKIALAGFSLGGNMMLKYLGDHLSVKPPQIKAAAAFSVPVDLAGGSRQMEKKANAIYMHIFLKSLNKKLRLKNKLFPGMLNLEGLHKIKTFHEWDHRFTGPIHGFLGAEDYYNKSSSLGYLAGIEIPTLLVNAKNDPFLSQSCFPQESLLSPEVMAEYPAYGGHCGFAFSSPNAAYYSEERAFQFFSNIL